MAQNKKAKTSSIAEMEHAICRDLLSEVHLLVLEVTGRHLNILENNRYFETVAKEFDGMNAMRRLQYKRYHDEYRSLSLDEERPIQKLVRKHEALTPVYKAEFERVHAGTAVASVLVAKLRIYKSEMEALKTQALADQARMCELGEMVMKL